MSQNFRIARQDPEIKLSIVFHERNVRQYFQVRLGLLHFGVVLRPLGILSFTKQPTEADSQQNYENEAR